MSDDANSPRKAVALSYEDGEHAPKVVAQGYGKMAERIIEAAKSHGVYVHDSPELVGLLMQLDIDDHIPPQMYQVIAELLVWLRDIDSKQALGGDVPG
ncbi:MAG: EscU/YscU/HrcU family type III secretion system export apparatus switch protein [Porticoccus sp.]